MTSFMTGCRTRMPRALPGMRGSALVAALAFAAAAIAACPASALTLEAARESCRMSAGRPIVQACVKGGGGSLEACRAKATPAVRACVTAALNAANGRANVAVAAPTEEAAKVSPGTALPAGFVPPPGVRAVHLQGAPLAPPAADTYCAGLPAHAPNWDDLAWLQGQTRLPLWLKGVLHPQDARQAQALGVAGLIVSNHGGRTLDTAPATANALPLVREAVQDALPLIVDGGIRRGTDVLKAIALGARAVLVGRPALHALAAGGALGVAQMLRLLRDELEMAMALTGCRTLADAGPALLDPGAAAPIA